MRTFTFEVSFDAEDKDAARKIQERMLDHICGRGWLHALARFVPFFGRWSCPTLWASGDVREEPAPDVRWPTANTANTARIETRTWTVLP